MKISVGKNTLSCSFGIKLLRSERLICMAGVSFHHKQEFWENALVRETTYSAGTAKKQNKHTLAEMENGIDPTGKHSD